MIKSTINLKGEQDIKVILEREEKVIILTVDFIVKNGKLVLEDEIIDASVAINDGKIVALGKESHLPKAEKYYDATGKIVIPGVIDDHVHAFQFEDFVTCTKAAAAGGLTTIMDHPIMGPAGFEDEPSARMGPGETTTTIEAFAKKRKICERDSFIDFCVLGGITPENVENIQSLVDVGAVGFKAGIYDIVLPMYPRMNDGLMLDAFRKNAEVGSIIGVHAENDEMITHFTEKLKNQGRKDPSAHEETRPIICELEATSRGILFSKATNSKLHVFHCSVADGVELAYQAKSEGYPVTVETCPHYLVLNKDHVNKLGPYAKINPPIRSKEEVERLWKKIAEGKCDIIASDHCVWPKEDKDRGKDDIFAAPGGFPGIQNMLSLVLNEGVHRRGLSINLFVKMMCENPAKIWGIYPQKGAIRIGSDADLTIIDLNAEQTIRSENLYSQAGWSTYEGWKVKGVPVATIVRGKKVAENGEVVGERGFGEFVSFLK